MSPSGETPDSRRSSVRKITSTSSSSWRRFCRAEQVAIWAYCLMPNHVHLIVVPQSAESLRRAIGEAHRRYTRRINFREGWRGHLWQGRFASSVMDEDHLLTAARYVEFNPMRAGLVQAPSRYRWSSVAAHLKGRDDALVQVAPLLQMAPNSPAVSSAISTSRVVICSPALSALILHCSRLLVRWARRFLSPLTVALRSLYLLFHPSRLMRKKRLKAPGRLVSSLRD